MPVYLLTAHAYRSWREDRPQGYVQRDEGLQEPNEALANWRADHANHDPAKFDDASQRALLEIGKLIAVERAVRLHAQTTTISHVHELISYRSPACTCGASNYCYRHCAGRIKAEDFITRLKRKMG